MTDGYIKLMNGKTYPIKKSGQYFIVSGIHDQLEVRYGRLDFKSARKINTVKIITNGYMIDEVVVPSDTEALEIYHSVNANWRPFTQLERGYNTTVNKSIYLPPSLSIANIPSDTIIANLDDFIGKDKVSINFRAA